MIGMLTNYIQVYEQAFLGIGTSMWTIIILAILWALTFFALLILYLKLGPTQGYLYAAFGKNDDRNVGIIFQNHSITIKKLKYFSGVFERLGLTWIARKPEHHLFGVCSAEVIADYWGLTMDPQINIATLQFIKIWNNELSEDELNAIKETHEYDWIFEIEDRPEIIDFDSMYAAIEKAPTDAEIRTKAFSYVPIYELQKYYPKNLTASDLTGYEEAMRKVAEEERMSAATSYLPIICLVIGILMGAGIMFLKG